MILIGLNYLHTNDIVHRDMNPRNILVDLISPGFKILLITDFGLSKIISDIEKKSQTLGDRTATFYKAPEVFKGETKSPKVDMWALGIILFEMSTKKHPITKEIDIFDSNPLEIPSTVPPLIASLLAKLLEKNPEIRPSAAELLNLPEVNEAVRNLYEKINAIDPEVASKIFENTKKFKLE